jgi:hypothetical protein
MKKEHKEFFMDISRKGDRVEIAYTKIKKMEHAF